MTAQCKLRVANVLMLVGMLPLILGIGWTLAAISYAQQHKGAAGGSDAFLFGAVLLATYGFAVVVGGPSALWSAFLIKRNATLRTKSSAIMAGALGLILLAPLLAYLGISFRLYFYGGGG